MEDAKAKVVSKRFQTVFRQPLQGQVIEEEMAKVLNNLGRHLNYKGKIIGHLKAIAETGDNYLQMSLTSLPDISIRASSGWHEKEFTDLTLTVNIIVFGFEKKQLETVLDESISGTVFLNGMA